MSLISTSLTLKAHKLSALLMFIGLILASLSVMTGQIFAQNIEIRPQSGVAPLRPQAPAIPDSTRNQRNLPKTYQPLKKNDGIKPALPNIPDANKTVPLASHQRWCAERYKSYDIKTNNYQPLAGTVRKCISPFSSN